MNKTNIFNKEDTAQKNLIPSYQVRYWFE